MGFGVGGRSNEEGQRYGQVDATRKLWLSPKLRRSEFISGKLKLL